MWIALSLETSTPERSGAWCDGKYDGWQHGMRLFVKDAIVQMMEQDFQGVKINALLPNWLNGEFSTLGMAFRVHLIRFV